MTKKLLGYGIVGLLALVLIVGTAYIVLSPSSARASQGQSRTGQAAAEHVLAQGEQRTQPNAAGTGYRSGQSETSLGGGGTPIDGMLHTVHGVAVEVDNDLILRTESGDVAVGLGPAHYREQAGFTIRLGDELEISGFDEVEEFKAASVHNLTTGTSITLRDGNGRPMWAGQGNLRNQP
jgi:hypothetical protein